MYGIFTYIWLILMVHVGKYTSRMDGMGMSQESSCEFREYSKEDYQDIMNYNNKSNQHVVNGRFGELIYLLVHRPLCLSSSAYIVPQMEANEMGKGKTITHRKPFHFFNSLQL